jgi:fluoroquinolone resistance protein
VLEPRNYAGKTFTALKLIDERVDGAEFDECVLDHCILSGSEFNHCRFASCRFTACDLSNIKLTSTRFRGIRFETTKILGVDWTKTDAMNDPHANTALSFTDCVLDLSSFFGLNLRGATIERCIAKEADFGEADLRDAVCRRTDFSGARFHGTNLEGADFREALGYVIDARSNKVKGARFSLPEAVSLLRGLDIVIDD